MKLIDMHCDTISELWKKGGEESLAQNRLCVDIPGMKRAGSLAQFFACFVNVSDIAKVAAQQKSAEIADEVKQKKTTAFMGEEFAEEKLWDAAWEHVLTLIEYARRQESEELSFIAKESEIEEQAVKGRISGILTVEEGGVLNGKAERLSVLYDRGVRLVTLTWNYENCLGFPNSRDPETMRKGLKPFGKEMVGELNRLGILIDVSHLSDGGFWDCLKISRAPIVASHSNARALCAHPRNLTDEMLHALGEAGGIVGVNFYSSFLTGERKATLHDIARHAVHMVRNAGEEAVALGTDFDGFEPESLPLGIRGIQDMEKLWTEMKKEGFTERQLDKIWHENVYRVIRNVWK